MAGLDPAIHAPPVPRPMAGSNPAMTSGGADADQLVLYRNNPLPAARRKVLTQVQ
jgi:hypothetical protein